MHDWICDEAALEDFVLNSGKVLLATFEHAEAALAERFKTDDVQVTRNKDGGWLIRVGSTEFTFDCSTDNPLFLY